MDDMISLTIDGENVTVPAGTTILEAARQIGIDIPTICLHEATTPNGLCRTCVVEVEGWRVLAASCLMQVSHGMTVSTRTERVVRSRRTILEMLAATIDLSDAPTILELLRDYQTRPDHFPMSEPRLPAPIDDNPMYLRDYAKCLLCWRCVQVCAEDAQYAFAINFSRRGYQTQVGTFYDHGMTETSCVFCGQCIGVCPTGSLKPKREWLLEQGKTPAEIVSMVAPKKSKRLE